MITTADALDLMLVVQACHRRTAPRMDDEQATLAIAAIWAELFNEYRLEQADLIAAVKKRARSNADAPEPAEIIHYAREIRRDRSDRATDRSEYEALCEAKGGGIDREALAAVVKRTSVDVGKEIPHA